MSDEMKLDLARAIHGCDHASRASFSPTLWAGVERAWAWVNKHYERRAEPVFLNEWMERNYKALGITQPPQDQQMKQEQNQPWTDEQREAARDLYPTELRDECANDLCKEIARVAPLFVEPRAVVKVNRHYSDIGLDVDVVGLDASSMHTEMIPWSEIDRCRTPRAAPSIEAIMQTYWLARSAHQSADEPEREAVREVRDMLVRALCIGEQGDGAVSVIGNTHGRSVVAGSSPAAPSPAPAAPNANRVEAWATEHEWHKRMSESGVERVRCRWCGQFAEYVRPGDPCEVSATAFGGVPFIHERHDEPSKVYATKPAPFAPDREALPKYPDRHGLSGTRWGDTFFMLASEAEPALRARDVRIKALLAERDALQAEVEKLRRERDEWKRVSDRRDEDCGKLADSRRDLIVERDTALARVRELEARPAKRSVTREELATIVYNYEISEKPMTAALASVGIEVVP